MEKKPQLCVYSVEEVSISLLMQIRHIFLCNILLAYIAIIQGLENQVNMYKVSFFNISDASRVNLGIFFSTVSFIAKILRFYLFNPGDLNQSYRFIKLLIRDRHVWYLFILIII